MRASYFTLIDFDWDQSVESLRSSRIIKGDFDNEIIAHNKGKLCLHIKVKGEDVSFQLSLNGKLQISNPNAELLRRAISQLKELIVCSRWKPSEESSIPNQQRIDETKTVENITEERKEEKPLASSKEALDIIDKIDNAIKLENWTESSSWIIELRHLCVVITRSH